MAIDRATDTRIKNIEVFVKGNIRDIQASATQETNIQLTPNGLGFYTILENSLGGVELALNGKSFLLVGQTNPAENGLYVITALGPNTITRSTDFTTYQQIYNTRIQILEGDFAGNWYQSSTTEPFTIDTTPITIVDTDEALENLQSAVINLEVNKLDTNLQTAKIYVGNAINLATPVSVSGDVSLSPTGQVTIQSNVVSNSKLAQAPANTYKGNPTGLTANEQDVITKTAFNQDFETNPATFLTPSRTPSVGTSSNLIRADAKMPLDSKKQNRIISVANEVGMLALVENEANNILIDINNTRVYRQDEQTTYLLTALPTNNIASWTRESGYPQWVNTTIYLTANIFVKHNDKLYRSKQAVPVNQNPLNDTTEIYWELIGDATVSDIRSIASVVSGLKSTVNLSPKRATDTFRSTDGAFYSRSARSENVVNYTAQDPISFTFYTRTGAVTTTLPTGLQTTFNSTFYDVGGVVTDLGANSNATVGVFYANPTTPNTFAFLIGQTLYTGGSAVNDATAEAEYTAIVIPTALQTWKEIGRLVYRRDLVSNSNFDDLTRYSWIPTSSKISVTILQDGTTAQKGIVQLSNNFAGVSETLATTEKALSNGLILKEDKANKGIADGYAELDATGKVPLSQLPNIASSISTLSDVDLNLLDNNQVLVYNSSLTKWENKPLSTQGSSGGELLPIGTIQAFYSNTIPAGYLLCDGSTFNAVDYPDLYTFLGSNTLPDSRGYFFRGLGGVDPDGSTRTLGSIQEDDLKSHNHVYLKTQDQVEAGILGYAQDNNDGNLVSTETSSTGGLETRPKNIAVNYIIKAKHNPVSAYNLVAGTGISITTNELDKTATISSTGYTNAQIDTALDLKENTITAGTTAQYYRGDKTFQTLNKAVVGLSNVDNTSDLLKPISNATQTALNLKEDKASKNVAGGYVGLDSNSLISIPQILPSRFIAAGTNITLNEDATTKIVTISSTGGGLPSDTLFSFRERIGSINWTINGGSNTFFNFTDEFFTQAIVDEDFNFLTGANPYFTYDSVGQKLLMRSNLTNQRIKFKITLRVSYNGGAGSEFGFVLGRPSLTTNTSITNTIGVQKATQGQNIQSTQVIKHELTLFTTLLPTTGGTDPFQTEGFKLGFFNYSTGTSITITDAQLVIEQIN